ncbi:MAG: signal recognition particle protein [Deltaproteobacteria bacterium]|nr:signal recognition particle protein [Deltaproteobacteria bacterium]
MFQELTQKFTTILDKLKDRPRLTEEHIQDILRQIRLSLLEADVNFKVVKDLVAEIQAKAVGEELSKHLKPDQQFLKIFQDALTHTMGEAQSIDLKHKAPIVIMMVGLQGSGKTTSTAKLALYFKKQKKRHPYLVPADVHRPAAIDQLKSLAARLDLPVYDTKPGDKAVKVAVRAIKEAKDQGHDLVLLDTAGRLQLDSEMMEELKQIKKKCEIHHSLFVVDAMAGQEAVNVAKAFDEALGISGVLLTKLDGDARGGAALSVRYVTGKPIYFCGVGEKPEDLEPFYPDRLARRILGMGDMLGLIEKAQAEINESEAKEAAAKLLKNQFTLEDFKKQLGQMKKLGGVSKLMGFLPGMGKLTKQVDPKLMEKELKRKEAMINSMTIQERRFPRLINGRRRLRIAKGSGTQVSDINRLLKEFEQMQKMMKKFGKLGMKGLGKMLGGL